MLDYLFLSVPQALITTSHPLGRFLAAQWRALCAHALQHDDKVLQHERPSLPHEKGASASVEDGAGQSRRVALLHL